jgi:hypothetical protein
MEKFDTTKRMSTILFICLIIWIIGGIFQIQHYPFGKILTYIGMGSYVVLSLIELDRLRKLSQKQM